MCSIGGCTHNVMYSGKQVCQKHYFRFMRYGTYDLTRGPKRRTQNKAGYQMIPSNDHPLAMKNGYVYEHRMVYFDSGLFDGKCSV